MYTGRGYNKTPIGKLYDGYKGEQIFKAPTKSMFYDFETDSQCRVPLPKREILKRELGLLDDNVVNLSKN